MKDPAVLWYFNDWGGGTIGMTRHQKGCYMDLLYAQFNLGDLSLEQIKNVLGSDFGPHWPTLLKKFKHDQETDTFYNERLKQEREKRSSFTASRRSNASVAKATDKHMENVNENRIINSIEYLRKLPDSDLSEFNLIYKASKQQIQDKASALVLWCESNGRVKKNYRAFLLVALNKDFEKRPPVVVKPQTVDTRAPLPKEIVEEMRNLTQKFKTK